MSDWLSRVQLPAWSDSLDILLLAVLVYALARRIRGTRAVQMLTGVMLILVADGIARLLHLRAMHLVLTQIVAVVPFMIVVIFQNTIRRLLSALGQIPFSRLYSSPVADKFVEQVVLASSALAAKRIGALIVFEREQGLLNFTETGIHIDALLSYDLLVNIFQPRTPLHDGAAIIRGRRIAAAGCFLPLTANPQLSTEFGSRHRAAIGITEETDAVALVVSEERGSISLAHDGLIQRGLDRHQLSAELKRLLEPRLRAAALARSRRWGRWGRFHEKLADR
ncbi:MAG: diadenylate cyclase CdaA [Acidobacteriota bacterium]